jgi:hypothetical protein
MNKYLAQNMALCQYELIGFPLRIIKVSKLQDIRSSILYNGKDLSNNIVLVMDMQLAILRNLGYASLLIKNLLKTIDNVQITKIPVTYITNGFKGAYSHHE